MREWQRVPCCVGERLRAEPQSSATARRRRAGASRSDDLARRYEYDPRRPRARTCEITRATPHEGVVTGSRTEHTDQCTDARGARGGQN